MEWIKRVANVLASSSLLLSSRHLEIVVKPGNEFAFIYQVYLLYLKQFFKFFLKNISEQHTATALVNLLYFLRPVSSDHADFIREFEQDT